MSEPLDRALKTRLRYDLKDLDDDEYESYVNVLLTPSDNSLFNKLYRLKQAEYRSDYKTHQSYKIITIRGKKRRVPVSVNTKVQPRDDAVIKECLYDLLGYDSDQDIVEQLEADDRAFVVMVGFACSGDLAKIGDTWYVITKTEGFDVSLEPTCTNRTSEVNSVLDLDVVYRVITNH